MTEKRKHKRVPLYGTATLRVKDRDGERSLQALPANISLGGIGLYSDDAIETQTGILMNISFVSAEGEAQADSLEGEVIYVKKIGDIYFLGIRFSEEIDAENAPMLHAHIRKTFDWNK
ncbi:MAG: PilZ domain-containing protein [Nitrospirota bacterium]